VLPRQHNTFIYNLGSSFPHQSMGTGGRGRRGTPAVSPAAVALRPASASATTPCPITAARTVSARPRTRCSATKNRVQSVSGFGLLQN